MLMLMLFMTCCSGLVVAADLQLHMETAAFQEMTTVRSAKPTRRATQSLALIRKFMGRHCDLAGCSAVSFLHGSSGRLDGDGAALEHGSGGDGCLRCRRHDGTLGAKPIDEARRASPLRQPAAASRRLRRSFCGEAAGGLLLHQVRRGMATGCVPLALYKAPFGRPLSSSATRGAALRIRPLVEEEESGAAARRFVEGWGARGPPLGPSRIGGAFADANVPKQKD